MDKPLSTSRGAKEKVEKKRRPEGEEEPAERSVHWRSLRFS